MNAIKNTFSIKDLENISGIKAHTIRIWEKRYALLEPERTDTNIRYYSLESLQKLLNITLLYNNNYKISKISKLDLDGIKETCKILISESAVQNRVLNDFKIAMLHFDVFLFEETYQKLLKEMNFREVFNDYFIPFLNEIGLLWQTDAIYPAHEHFISELIKQKIQVQIEKHQALSKSTNETFVLFLPEEEIHDLGLLYVSYELLSNGKNVIYLGQKMPVSSLQLFVKTAQNITFIPYCTVSPETDKLESYINELYSEIIIKSNSKLWVLGSKANELLTSILPTEICLLPRVSEAIEKIKHLSN